MKRMATILAAVTLAMAAPITGMAAGHDHGARHGGDMKESGTVAHEEVIEGVTATFEIHDMREQMKGAAPAGMKETHHVMVVFTDVKSGGKITEGEVKVKIQGPGKTEQIKDLMGMQGHFGADFNLSQQGKYGVMCKIRLKDGKARSAKFWYTVK